MKTLTVDVPDRLAKELDAVVREGWFKSEDEVLRHTLLEFLPRRRLELMEQYQLEDVAWAAAKAKRKSR